MSETKLYADLKAKIGEYTDKDGKTKGRWVDVGVLFASEHFNNMYIRINALPVSKDWDGTVAVFKRESVEQKISASVDGEEVNLDGIPF